MFPQLAWELRSIGTNQELSADQALGQHWSMRRSYATKKLRYWFIYHFLRNQYLRQKAPITVCELGIDKGQMLRFSKALAGAPETNMNWSRWVGVDCFLKRDRLDGIGYHDLIEADFEDPTPPKILDEGFDAIIMLHVLEHLRDPEAVVARIASKMKPGSILVGGYPSVPNLFVSMRQAALRKKAAPGSHGHVSVFSACRTRKIAKAAGLNMDFISGAYFLRADGYFIEDYAWWARFNLFYGALFPSAPGEVYWVMRKPE